MEVNRVITGTWFPRTKLHLKEFYDFMKDGDTRLEENEETARELRKKMKPHNVKYIGARFDRVSAECGDIEIIYQEDGLLTLTTETIDYKAGSEMLDDFYNALLSEALKMLYGKGAPELTYMIAKSSKKATVALVQNKEEVDVRKFCAEMGEEVHYIARHTERTVYYSKNIIVIDDSSGGSGITNHVIDNVILAREYERRLKNYLELYRTLWEKIATIQSRSSIPSYELPMIRDRLLNYRRDIAIIRARISQMIAYVRERKSEIDDLGITEDLRAVEAYRFDKMSGATYYITRLWDMLKDYLDSTVEITGFFYQENLQKEISIQQFIFLVGAVGTVIGLGTIASAAFIVMSTEGEAVFSGLITSFDIYALARFGGVAILASFVIYFGIRPAIRIFQRVRPSALLGRVRISKGKNDEEDALTD